MIEFRINLLRGRVPPSATRRRRYWAMVAYLGASGLLLVYVLSVSVARWMEGRAYELRGAEMEKQFRSGHPAADSIRDYARTLRRQSDSHRAALDELSRAMERQIRPANMIHALVFSLPKGAALRQFSIDARDNAVSFEILMMGGHASATSGPSDLLEKWAQNADLVARIRNITFVGSQVEAGMARDDTVWRFSGALTDEGG